MYTMMVLKEEKQNKNWRKLWALLDISRLVSFCFVFEVIQYWSDGGGFKIKSKFENNLIVALAVTQLFENRYNGTILPTIPWQALDQILYPDMFLWKH